MRLLLAVALLVVAGAAAEEQAAVDVAGAGEIAVGVKEAAEAAALRAELAQLREKISPVPVSPRRRFRWSPPARNRLKPYTDC